jgi:predicted ArsR family transcriptional regulator
MTHNEVCEFMMSNFFTDIKRAIIHVLDITGEGTAREVAEKMEVDVKKIRPRMTDLIDHGFIEKCGSKYCSVARHSVTVYRLKK